MTAQSKYLSSIFLSLSTFLESALSHTHERDEAHAVFTEFVASKASLSSQWQLSELHRFLTNSAAHQTVSPSVRDALMMFVQKYPPYQTSVFLHEYLLALKADNCSSSTIKNYRSDINQFVSFTNETEVEKAFTKPKAELFIAAQANKDLKESSIRRKLVSIVQFSLWLQAEGVLHSVSEIETLSDKLPQLIEKAPQKDIPIQEPTRRYSSVPTSSASSFATAKHTLHNQSNAQSSQDIRSRIKSGLATIQNKIQPQAKKQALPYLNLAIIMLFAVTLGFFGYRQFVADADKPLAYPTSPTRPNRVLQFQGRLTDTSQNPITTATDMAFRLYDSNSGGTLLWNSGTCSVTPDQDGIFNADLGSSCGTEISENVFTENSNVWLEVEIDTETLSPRQSIKTVPYALNSETLQGYPIEATGAAIKNTVVTMNNNGEVIFGEVSPTLKAVSGNFSIEAETLTLKTAAGSNGNIALSPDGTGDVLVNSDLFVDGYIAAPGATLSATYAGGTALIARGGPSGSANIQVWQNNAGSALSVVDESGNIGIGTSNPNEALELGSGKSLRFNSLDANHIRFYDSTTETAFIRTEFSGVGPTGNDLILGSDLSSQTLVLERGGNVGIGTNDPSAHLQIANKGEATGTYLLRVDGSAAAGGFKAFGNNIELLTYRGSMNELRVGGAYLSTNPPASGAIIEGNVGIGSSIPAQKLDIVGNLQFSGALMPSGAAGTAGYVLQSNGIGVAPTWVSSATLPGSGLWDVTANVFHPKEAYGDVVDLAIGGTSTASADILLQSNGRAYFGGNVGIGTASGSYPLQVEGDALIHTASSYLYLSRTNTNNRMNYRSWDIDYGARADIRNINAAGILSFWTGGTAAANQRMTIAADGNVGIGTTSPVGLLNVEGAAIGKALSILNETGNQAIFVASASGTNRFIIQNDGNVGIGTSAPTALFQISDRWQGTNSTFGSTNSSGAQLNYTGSVATPIFTFTGDTDTGIGRGGANILNFFTNNTEQVRIASDGNVGIGTTNPQEKLDVLGDVRIRNTSTNTYYFNYNTVHGDGRQELEHIGAGGTSRVFEANGGRAIGFGPEWGASAWGITAPILTTSNSLALVGHIVGGGLITSGTHKSLLIGTPESSPTTGYGITDTIDLGTVSFASNTWSGTRPAMRYTASEHNFRVNSGTGNTNPGTSALFIDANGNIGISSETPIGLFNVDGAAIGKALVILNETGNQDIIAASASGVTRFRVAQDGYVYGERFTDISNSTYYVDPAAVTTSAILNGNVGIGTTTANYTLDIDGELNLTDAIRVAGDAGTLGWFLTSSAGGVNTWTDPASITGAGYWAETDGVLHPKSPYTSVVDLALGGNSTASANIHLQSNGKAYFAGNVGIGTNSPIGLLNIEGAATGKALAILNETGNQAIFTASASGVSKVTIANSGNVGIATTAPQEKLVIASTADQNTRLHLKETGISWSRPIDGFYGWSSTAGSTSITSDNDVSNTPALTYNAYTNHIFQVNQGTLSQGLFIGRDSTSGFAKVRVGTGSTSATSSLLSVNGSATIGNGYISSTAPTNGLLVQGNVGIGLTNPSYLLHVNGASQIDTLRIDQNASNTRLFTGATLELQSNIGGASSAVKISRNGGTAMSSGYTLLELGGSDIASMPSDGYLLKAYDKFVIQGSGNVGIGSITPAYKLDVTGDINLTGALRVAGDAGTSGYILTSTGGSANQWTNPDDIFTAGLWKETNGVFHPKTPYTDVVDLALGGNSTASANIHLQSNGQAYFGGSVGIGSTTPGTTLDVTGTGRFSSTLTASNGLTQTTGALNLTATSGALSLSGLSASSINTGANALTFTSSNFNTTGTGINTTNIGATTRGTGAFTTLAANSTVTLTGVATGTDNTVLVLNGSNQVISDEIDPRVWGTTLVDGSGTTNYLPKWTPDGDSLGNSIVYDNGTNVGIGTNNPGGKLTVAGSTGISRSVNIDNSEIKFRGDGVAHISIFGPDTGRSNLQINVTSASALMGTIGTNIATFATTGNVGIGTTVPGAKLAVSGGNILLDAAQWIGTGIGNGLELGSGSTYTANNALGNVLVNIDSNNNATASYFAVAKDNTGTSGTELFRIQENGNVGIGSATPAYKLDVVGDVSLSGAIRAGGDAGSSTFLLTSSGGGVNTWTDPADLTDAGLWKETNGVFHPKTPYTDVVDLALGGNSTASANIHLQSNGQAYFAGNVAIGTTSPVSIGGAQVLNVYGTGGANVVLGGNNGVVGGTAGSVQYGGRTAIYFSVGNNNYVNGNDRVATINASGNFGIGTTSPIGKLNVEGAAIGKALTILNETGNQDILAASASGTTRFRIAQDGHVYGERFVDISNSSYFVDPAAVTTSAILNGNVGIGTTTANYTLDVDGELNLTDALRVAGDAGTSGYFLTSSAGGANTWTDPASITGAGFWDVTSNVLHPKSPYTGVVDLAIGGNSTASANIHLQSNGQAYFAGNVGIGTSTPNTAKLVLRNSSTEDIFNAFDAGTEVMTIIDGGNVGIGSIAPGTTFDVTGTGRFSSTLTLNGVAAGTDNTVLVLNGSNQVVQDEIDARVWGTTLIDGSGIANYVARFTDADTLATGVLYDNATNVGIGSTSPTSKLDVLGAINASAGYYYGGTGSPLSVELTRTVPTTVDDYVEIGNFNLANGAHNYRISVTVSDTAFSVSKQYIVPVNYNGTANTYKTLLPTVDGGAYSGNNYEVDLNSNANVATLRIRRTQGTTAGTAYVRIESVGKTTDVFTASSATGSTTAPTAYYNPLTQNVATGNVGIGTASPSEKLEVYGSAANIEITASSGNGGIRFANAAGRFQTYLDGSTNNYVIDSLNGGISPSLAVAYTTGYVGIGTTAPATQLESKSLTGVNNYFRLNTTDADNATSANHLQFAEADVVKWDLKTIGNNADRLILDSASVSDVMTFNQDGNVGVGTTAPANLFEVNNGILSIKNDSTSPELRIERVGYNYWRFFNSAGHFYTQPSSGSSDYSIRDASNTSLFIVKGNGNVGIGTTGPGARLDVSGSGTNSKSLILRSGEGTSGFGDSEQIQFAYNGGIEYSQAIRTRHNSSADSGNSIDFYTWDFGTDAVGDAGTLHSMSINGGNVGIGSLNPTATLDVVGSINFNATTITFDDTNLSSAITLTDVDTGFDSADTGIVDAINTAYNAAIGSSGSGGMWTDTTPGAGSGIIYPSSATDDFAVGGTALAAAFSVDESNNLVRIGDGAGSSGSLNMYSSGGDTGSIVFNTSDQWDFSGGDVDFNQGVAIGPGIGEPATDRTLAVGTNFAVDNTTYEIYSSSTITSPTLTADRTSYGMYMNMINNKTEDIAGGFDSDAYGVYGNVYTTGTSTFRTNTGVYGYARNDSTATADLGTLTGTSGIAYQNAISGTIPTAYGLYGAIQGDTGVGSTSIITQAYGNYNQVYAYNSTIPTAYGNFNRVRTINSYSGDITNAYGTYNEVYVDSDVGGDITNGRAGYFITNKRATATNMTNAYGVYIDANSGTTTYGAAIYADDVNATNNYGIYLNALNASAQNYGIWGDSGDWILDADGDGIAGGTGAGGDLVLGESQDFELYHDGTNSYVNNLTGDLYIQSGSNDVILANTGGSVGVGTTSPAAVAFFGGGKTLNLSDTSTNLPNIRLQNATKDFTLGVDGQAAYMYSASALDYRFYTSGTEKFRIATSGNVGIGSTSPGYLFDVAGGTGIVGRFSGRVIGADAVNSDEFVTLSQLTSGTGSYWTRTGTNLLPTTAGDDVYLPTGSVLGVNYDPSTITGGVAAFNGNVGVGTITPGQLLDVVGEIELANYIYFANAATEYLQWNSSDFILSDDLLAASNGASNLGADATRWGGVYVGSSNVHIGATGNEGIVGYDTTNSWLTFDSNGDGAQEMKIESAGNVSIGTTSALSAKFYVHSGTLDNVASFRSGDDLARFEVRDNDGGGFFNVKDQYVSIGGGNSLSIENVNIDTANGNVGMGTTGPGAKLHISGAAANTFIDGDSASGSQMTIRGYTNTNNRLYIGYNTTSDYARIQAITEGTSVRPLALQESGGNVGIGITAPTALLHTLDGDILFDRASVGITQDTASDRNARYLSVLQDHIDVENSDGAYVITVPNTSNTMMNIKITGYNYNSTSGAWEVIIGGYWYDTGDAWINTSVEIKGKAPFNRVRLMKNGTTPVIVLGNDTDVDNWDAPQINVDVDIAGYSGQTGLATGWSAALSTDISALTADDEPAIAYYWNSAGNLGIGTVNPAAFKLEVAGNVGPAADSLYSLGSDTVRWQHIYADQLHVPTITGVAGIWDTDLDTGIQLEEIADEDKIRFDTAGSERMIIGADGNVGIGSTAPTTLLDIKGYKPGEALVKIQDTTGTLEDYVSVASSSGALMFRMAHNGDFYAQKFISRSNNAYFLEPSSIAHGAAIYGNVGIGTSSTPNAKLHVQNSGTEDILNLFDGSTEVLTVLDGGNVGIGTNDPTTKLDVYKAATGTALRVVGSAAGSTQDTSIDLALMNAVTANYGRIGIQATNGGTGIESGDMYFSTVQNGTLSEKMRIIGNGNVGIGTTGPSQLMQINSGSDLNLRISKSTYSDNFDFGISGHTATIGYTAGTATDSNIDISTNGTRRMYLTDDGNVGIGENTAVSAKVHVLEASPLGGSVKQIIQNITTNGWSGLTFWDEGYSEVSRIHHFNSSWATSGAWETDALAIANNIEGINLVADGASGDIEFFTGGQNRRMIIQSDGNVGIGTTTVVSKLQSSGAAQTTSPTGGSAAGTGLYITNTDANYGMMFGVSSSGTGWIQQQRSNAVNTQYPLLLNPIGGNIGIGTTTTNQKLTIGGAGAVLGVDNTAIFQAKNSGGTYESFLWPRWSDNVTYLNYGTGGFNIRNNTSTSSIFVKDDGNVGIGNITNPTQKLQVNGVGMFGTANVSEVLLGMTANTTGHEGLSLYHNGSASFIESIDASVAWHDMTFRGSNFTFSSAGSGNDFHIGSNGNIGIGTTASSDNKLTIISDVTAPSFTNRGLYIDYNHTAGTGGTYLVGLDADVDSSVANEIIIGGRIIADNSNAGTGSIGLIVLGGNSSYGWSATEDVGLKVGGADYSIDIMEGAVRLGTFGILAEGHVLKPSSTAANNMIFNKYDSAGGFYFRATSTVGGTSPYSDLLAIDNDGNTWLGKTDDNSQTTLKRQNGTTEGGHLVLQQGGSYTSAVNMDSYGNSFRLWNGPATTSTADFFNNNGTQVMNLTTDGSASDYAETIFGNLDMEGGDIIYAVPAENEDGVRSELTTSENDSRVIGVISTAPGTTLKAPILIEGQLTRGTLIGKYTQDVKALWPELQPVALSGRVPVKVITNPGEVIEAGKAIVSSKEKGIGQKAKVAGMSVGKTMTSFNPSSMSCTPVSSVDSINWPADPDGNNQAKPCYTLPDGRHVGKVMIMVSNSYVDPTIQITDNGMLALTTTNGSFTATYQGSALSTIGGFSKALIAELRAGLITTQRLVVEQTATISNLSVNSLTIQGMSIADYIAGIVNSSSVSNSTALISPVGNNTVITTATVSGEIAFTNTDGDTVAAITEEGDFSATGTSSLGSLLVQNDATISGTLTVATLSAQTSKLGSIMADGPATFSATVSAESLIANQITATSTRLTQMEAKLAEVEKLKAVAAEIETATVSGTLYANNIDGLDTKIYTATAAQKSSLLDIVTGTDSITNINDVIQAVDSVGYTATQSADLNVSLSELTMDTDDISLNVDALFVNKYFKVNGGAYIAGNLGIGNSIFVEKDIAAGESVTVANTLTIGSDSIAYTGTNTFEIQPAGTGSLSLMAGLMILEENGTATVNGNFTIEGDTTVKGTLFADLLAPTDYGNPLQVQVAGISDTNEVKKSRFEIIDELGTPVATISAEGKAEFAGGVSLQGGLSVGTEDLGAADLNNVDGANRPILNSNKTSGKATIPSGTKEITIRSNKVGPDSLIYVTPVGSTNNKVLYVISQQDENPTENRQGEFVVGFDEALTQEVHLNWWIVN